MFYPQSRRDNAKRMLNRRGPVPDVIGTRSAIRAAAPAGVRLRCNGPKAHRFKAADRMRCPMCCHDTVVVGEVK